MCFLSPIISNMSGENVDGPRSMREIMLEVAPVKSGPRYERAWEELEKFLGERDTEKPVEEDQLIQYFDYMRRTREWKSSTCWSTYSCLSNCSMRLYGKKFSGKLTKKNLSFLKSFHNRKTTVKLTFFKTKKLFKSAVTDIRDKN